MYESKKTTATTSKTTTIKLKFDKKNVKKDHKFSFKINKKNWYSQSS